MSGYQFQTMGLGFSVSGNFPKQYGIVMRAGKRHYRKYGRELKNGKGLTWIDLLHKRQEDLYATMMSQSGMTAFYTGVVP